MKLVVICYKHHKRTAFLNLIRSQCFSIYREEILFMSTEFGNDLTVCRFVVRPRQADDPAFTQLLEGRARPWFG
jgi:hypothetical protein